MKVKLIILFIFFAITTYAQTPVHREFNMQQGLPSYRANCILQDNDGFIWIGTQHGLSYFDGYKFHNFYKENGLINNNIVDIYQDKDNTIWIIEEGLNINYYQNNKIFKYKFNDEIKKKITFSHRYIKNSFIADKNQIQFSLNNFGSFIIDSLGNIKKTENKLLYNGYNLVKQNSRGFYCINPNISNDTLIFNKIKYKINDNIISVSNIMGINIIAEKNNLKFYLKDRLIKIFKTNSNIISLKKTHNLLWVFTKSTGILLFNVCGKGISLISKSFKNIRASDIIKDNENGYWISTLNHGIIYIPDIYYNEVSLIGLNKNNILTDIALFKDNLYVGYSNGIVEDILRHKTFKLFKNNESEYYELKFSYNNTYIYLLYNNIIYKFNGKKLKNIINNNILSKNKIDKIIDISTNNTNNLVVASTNKIIFIKNDKINKIIDLKNNISDDIQKIHLSNSNNIFISTYRNLYQYTNNEITKINTPNNILNCGILDITSDKNGKNIFIATNGNGLIIIDKNKKTHVYNKNNMLTSNIVSSVYYSDSALFIGLNNGINTFKINKNNKLYNKKTFTEDYDNENKFTKKFIIYKNELLQLSNTGLKQIQYKNDVTYEIIPKIKLTKIRVLEKDTMFETSRPLLKYYENYLSFQFTAISYKNAGNIDYKYRLLGSGSGWKYTNLRKVEYPFLPPGNYRFEVYASNKNGKWSKPAIFSFTIMPPIWKRWWFILIVSLLALLLIFIIFAIIIKHTKNKQKLKHEIIKYRQQALRKQMNPHFIFNALNSIQHYILQNDKRTSSRYLSKFSSLMRLVLENTKSDLITLEQELETVKLYLDIESLRFKNRFEYSIETDNDIDTLSIKIPPLLFQPFIENAIWHGIMNLDDDKTGKITINIEREDNYVICKITDNGVGRKIASKNNLKNKGKISLGDKITKSRVELVNAESSSNKISIKYHDIKNKKGIALGTVVEIKIMD